MRRSVRAVDELLQDAAALLQATEGAEPSATEIAPSRAPEQGTCRAERDRERAEPSACSDSTHVAAAAAASASPPRQLPSSLIPAHTLECVLAMAKLTTLCLNLAHEAPPTRMNSSHPWRMP